MTEINPNDSATGFAFSSDQRGNTGLTIRAKIAAMAMQGILANKGYTVNPEFIANQSRIYADALIKELNKTT